MTPFARWPKGARRVAVGVLGFVAALLLTAGFEIYCVQGRSMTPNLGPGACLLVAEGYPGALGTVSRGEIVVFRADDGRATVKRAVAMGGDTVGRVDGRLTLDGRPLSEPYLGGAGRRRADPDGAPGVWHRRHLVDTVDRGRYVAGARGWGPIVVPPDAYFVLGDNREVSGDSRDFGFVTADDLVGPVILTFRPPAVPIIGPGGPAFVVRER